MAYTFDKAKILVVDDMRPMLELTKSVLNIFGFANVFIAEDTNEAYEIVCKEDPDLIITDWLMKPENGLEFTRRVRRDPLSPNPYVPILLMTGFSSRIRVENARDLGITEFLVKPFAAKDLYARITQIIEKPRQFVDTGEFFGPDRRRRSDEDYEGPRKRDNDKEEKSQMTEEQQKKADEILKKLREDAKNVSGE